jgi:hypothetical protein
VRFGFLGEPAPDQQVAVAPAPQPQEPEAARGHLAKALGPAFLVFRGKVQADLQLSAEQQQKLEPRFEETAQNAARFFQELEGVKPEEREPRLAGYRRGVNEQFAPFLRETLRPEQLRRLRQLNLQREGALALAGPELGQELGLTDGQRQQLVAVIQELQRQMAPVAAQAQAGGDPQAVRKELLKIRKDHEGKMAAILTDAQRRQWQALLGPSLALDDE